MLGLYGVTEDMVVEWYDDKPYGEPTFYNASGEMIAESAYGNRMLWTGRE